MSKDIKTVDARNRIKPQREPVYVRIKTGCYLGYRKMSGDTIGTWVARCRVEATGKQAKTSLGNFEAIQPAKRYDAALEAATAWFKHLGMGGSTEVRTVEDACREYVKHIKTKKGERQGRETDARFQRWIYGNAIGKIQLAKLNKRQLDNWRHELATTPVVVNPYAANKITRTRAPASINRDMTVLRAALNHAHLHGNVATDTAWLAALKPIEGATKARDLYLDRTQRRALIDAAQPDVAQFLEGLCLLPLRPGALAGLTVANFDKRLSVLTIGKDKAGQDRKITLPQHTADLLKKLCKDKTPAAPIFAMSDGRAWGKDYWKGPIKEAVLKAELPGKTTAYTLRHSVITDLVPVLDLLTIAQISGTSVQMIEAHYGHLRQHRAAQALAGLTL